MRRPFGLTLISAPASPVLTTGEAKAHCRVSGSDDDGEIDAFVAAATDYVETICNRQFVTATWLYSIAEWPCENRGEIRLPLAPLQSITSLKYIDTDGTLQTLSASLYQVSTYSEPGRVRPARNEVWPTCDPESFDSVQVRFVAGYGDPADVPEKAKLAVKLLVGHLYENREATIERSLSMVPLTLKAFIHSLGYGEVV